MEQFYQVLYFVTQHKLFTKNIPSHSTSAPPVLSDRHFSLARARQISYSSGKRKPENQSCYLHTHMPTVGF